MDEGSHVQVHRYVTVGVEKSLIMSGEVRRESARGVHG